MGLWHPDVINAKAEKMQAVQPNIYPRNLASQNGRHFGHCIFKSIFLNEMSYMWIKFLFQRYADICSEMVLSAINSIGSVNGLTPRRWQAIIWTNEVLIYWRIYASHGLGEFMCFWP